MNDALLVLRLAPAGLAVLGLAIGSFLNVVVHRVPRRLSVVNPPSACPGCGSRIAARDNIPVVSWLLLRGRCRGCRTSIPARYPLVEALTALAFVGVAVRFAPSTPDAAGLVADVLVLAAFLVLAAAGIALAAIDLEVRRLPDAIVLPTAAAGAVLLGAAALLRGDLAALAGAVIGGAACFALHLALALARPGGMGMGDVKLAGALGIFLGFAGPAPLLVGLFAAYLIGGIAGLAVIALRRGTRTTALPFGPFLIGGAAIGIAAGDPIASLYLSLVGLS